MNQLSEDIPTFDVSAIPLMEGANLDVMAIEQELSELPHLDGDKRHEVGDVDREFRNAMQAKNAADVIGRLPGPREAIHLAISGKFALFDVITAALDFAAPAIIDVLHIATLGFSKNNVAAMCDLLDAGRIGRLTLLASHYFAGTSESIYAYGAEELAKRGQTFFSIRNHAKILAMRFTDGRTLTVESSANLRSCQNIEQLTLIGDPGLYTFHVGWIGGLTK